MRFEKGPGLCAWTRVILIFCRRVAVPWHTRTPPMALAQVSAGSTRRHTGRTRPTGVCGDHVGGPETYARAQAAMALAAHASVRPATRVATLYSTRAGLWGQLTVAHGPHSAQLSVWRPCVLVWEPTPATDRTRITMSCQNDRRTQSFLCLFRVGVLKHRVANMCPRVKAVGGTHTCVWH